MIYRLLYGDLDLGEVRQVDSDHMTSFGTWSPAEFDDSSELKRHLKRYIAYSIESMAVLEETNAGSEWQALAAREEHKYQDLIDSRQWRLVRADGTILRILIPNFCPGSEINWRCDLDP